MIVTLLEEDNEETVFLSTFHHIIVVLFMSVSLPTSVDLFSKIGLSSEYHSDLHSDPNGGPNQKTHEGH